MCARHNGRHTRSEAAHSVAKRTEIQWSESRNTSVNLTVIVHRTAFQEKVSTKPATHAQHRNHKSKATVCGVGVQVGREENKSEIKQHKFNTCLRVSQHRRRQHR